MITLVSGLPRSGTSLMMQMLKAGGMEILTDNVRTADDNNPKGYYEYEKVKSLLKDNSWLNEAEGRAVKVIAQLVPYLPPDFQYKIIFMERNLEEVVKSQAKMIDNLKGKQSTMGNKILLTTFSNQVEKVKKFLTENSNFTVAYVSYDNLLKDGESEFRRAMQELDIVLEITSAVAKIDRSLHRTIIK